MFGREAGEDGIRQQIEDGVFHGDGVEGRPAFGEQCLHAEGLSFNALRPQIAVGRADGDDAGPDDVEPADGLPRAQHDRVGSGLHRLDLRRQGVDDVVRQRREGVMRTEKAPDFRVFGFHSLVRWGAAGRTGTKIAPARSQGPRLRRGASL